MSLRPVTPEDLLKFTFVSDPQPHPQGGPVLFQKKHYGEKNKTVTALFTVDAGGTTKQLTRGSGGASGGRWSPDGHLISFESTHAHLAQLFVLPFDGGEAFPITAFPEGSFGEHKWSPDGQFLAFTFREAIPAFTKEATKKRESEGGSIPPVEIDDIWYRLDGDGYFAGQRYAVYVFEVAAALEAPAKLEQAKLKYTGCPIGMYSFDWLPDSSGLIIAHSANAFPMRETPNDQLYRVSIDGDVRQLPGLPKGEKSEPRVSPDGLWIAYAGDVDENDPWGTRNTKIYRVSVDGGEPIDLTGAQDYDMAVGTLSDTAEASFGTKLIWASDGSGLYVQLATLGEIQVGFVAFDGGVSLLTDGAHAISLGGISADGRITGTVSTPVHLPEIAVVVAELGTGRLVPKILTGFNQAVQDEIKFRAPSEIEVASTDGTHVHGWVILPEGDGPHPVCLNIHGGPHAQYGWTFFHEFQVQAAAGYAVVYTNPRGSKGYGEAHCAAIRGDWGNKDWDDIQAVTAWIQSNPALDSDRMAVMGGSYGGYMTNWVIGHTDVFRCAISDRCVSNMVSMAGNSDFAFNKDGYFKGVAWGSLEEIRELWRVSPLAYFEGVKTPTLVIHSVGDLRCNVEQSDQVFHALQQQGVPSRYVRYPVTTSHGLSRSGPADLRLHRLHEYLNWIRRWM